MMEQLFVINSIVREFSLNLLQNPYAEILTHNCVRNSIVQEFVAEFVVKYLCWNPYAEIFMQYSVKKCSERREGSKIGEVKEQS